MGVVDVPRGCDCHANLFITKPATLDALVELVESLG
jgi:hypothetical protein